MNRKQLSILVVFLLLAVTTITVYAAITVDGDVTTDMNETEWASADCIDDVGGVNDNLGGERFDLTRSCVYEGEYYSTQNVFLYWNLDAASFTIATESCALFDDLTDGNSNADFALCGTVNGSPSSLTSSALYSCDDSSATICVAPMAITFNGSCAVATNSNDPFVGGADTPNDTTIECQLPIADIGANTSSQTRSFLDVCVVDSGITRDCVGATDVPLAISLDTISANNNNIGLIATALVCAMVASSLFIVRRRRIA